MKFSIHDLNNAVVKREFELFDWCQRRVKQTTIFSSLIGAMIGFLLGLAL